MKYSSPKIESDIERVKLDHTLQQTEAQSSGIHCCKTPSSAVNSGHNKSFQNYV